MSIYSQNRSKEHTRKISLAQIGNKRGLGYIHTEETRKRISEMNKGKIISLEVRKKLSQIQKEKWKNDKITERQKEVLFKKGEHRSLGNEFKKGEVRFKGETASNWQGGISFEPYGLAWTKQLRESIRERDNYVCQLCNKHQSQLKRKLSIHHIDYIKTNIFTFNLISICVNCHIITNNNRNHWTTFFRNYLSEKYGYKYNYQQKLLVDRRIV